MKIDSKRLAKLDKEYTGFLKADKLDAFYEEFDIPFAAGHWCAGDFCDRFAPDGYNSDDPSFSSDVIAQIERVAKAGAKGIEFHENVFTDEKNNIVESRIKEVKDACKHHGLIPTNMNTNLWTHPKWKLGSVTNANPRIRKDALAVALQCVDIAKAVGCKTVALWAGADGWDYNFQVHYGIALQHFIEAAIAINTKAKEKKLGFGIEAKLHEPREGNLVVSTTPKAMLIANVVNAACGGKNMGICIDYGHEQMYAVEPADMVHSAKVFGVPLVNFHVNTAKLHSNDEDRIVGTGDNWRQVDFCYAAIETGYRGWFGLDQFTYRMDPVKAITLAREMLGNLMKKALQIYARKADLKTAQKTGDAGNTIDVVKDILM